jgi:ribose transport system ATP-binding protein
VRPDPPESATLRLAARGIGKTYTTPVLSGVSLDLAIGEVHALVGENGAGKSTFSRILAGLVSPDTGGLFLNGHRYAPRNRADATRAGVRMVLQELNLISTLTVGESLFLDDLPQRWGWIDRRRLAAAARPLLEAVGLADLDPAVRVGDLGVGRQQLVEIAAGLARRCDLLILDEPTAALTPGEIDLLFSQIRRLKAAGTTILYISHRLEEIRLLCDRVSVLRDGCMVATRPTAELPLEDMIRMMVGRPVAEALPRTAVERGPVALRVARLRSQPGVREVSLEVRQGEIVGLAGLMGSGRTETLRAIWGADRPQAGAVYLEGSAQPARIRSPRDAVAQGVALLTEDRKQQGLLLPWPIRGNIVLASMPILARRGWIRRESERSAARHWIERLGVRCQSPEQPVLELSGGNQQKVVLAKWLLRDCGVLLCDEPTRGIDVGARFEVYQLLDQLAASGKAVVVASSDLRELMALCDRIVVLSAGRSVGVFERGAWTQEAILEAALSGQINPQFG